MDSKPLSVLMREYIRDYPGCEYVKIIGDVCELHHASFSDVDRVFWVLCRTHRIAWKETVDDDGFVHYCYFIPSQCSEPSGSVSDRAVPEAI